MTSHSKFSYEDDGFIFESNDGPKKIKWVEIKEMFAYKLDMLTFDEICLQVKCNDLYFIVTEETNGWAEFVSETKNIFPSIPKTWEVEIAHPPFATNETVIYQINNP